MGGGGGGGGKDIFSRGVGGLDRGYTCSCPTDIAAYCCCLVLSHDTSTLLLKLILVFLLLSLMMMMLMMMLILSCPSSISLPFLFHPPHLPSISSSNSFFSSLPSPSLSISILQS